MKRAFPILFLAAFVPAFAANVVPAHDALQIFTAFWTYVSGLAFDGRLPEWIPYGRYGTPSGPILMYLSPVAYLVGAIGALLHRVAGFSDTLLLFKLVVALEYVIFAAGMLRFGRLIFQSTPVQYCVAALGVLSSPWILSLDGNFHAFYMTPWVFASLTLAFQTGASRHLGAAAMFTAFACVGNVPYFPPFFLLQLTIFSIPLALAYRQNLGRLLFNRTTWLWLAGAALLFGVYFVALIKGMDGLAILSSGRDPLTNQVPLSVFVTYAGVAKPLPLLVEWLTGATTNGDNTWYMGLATLALAPLSLLLPGPPVLRSVRWLAVFLLLFSTGGVVASASYFFPGMTYYRHVSIVFGLFRILMFFCAGFVIDQLIQNHHAFAEWRAQLPKGAAAIAIFGVVGLAVSELVRAQQYGPDLALILFPEPGTRGGWMLPVLTRLVLYAAGFGLLALRSVRISLPNLLMTLLVLDLAVFTGAGWAQWPRLKGAEVATTRQLVAPRPVVDPGPRLNGQDVLFHSAYFRFLMDTRPFNFGTMYVHFYSWAGIDPCLPRLRTDFIAASIDGLFKRHGLQFGAGELLEKQVPADPVLARLLACQLPRVITGTRVTASSRSYDWIRLRADNASTGAENLTLSEAMAPGWRVTVDGAAAALAPSDPALLGVSVPPGSHEIEFRFHRPLVFWLRTLQAAAAAIAAAWMTMRSLRTLIMNAP